MGLTFIKPSASVALKTFQLICVSLCYALKIAQLKRLLK